MIKKSVPTPSPTKESSDGVIKARRKNIIQGWDLSNDITPGPRIRKILMRNDGANPIRVRFDSDAPSNYWTLQPGDQFPVPIEVIPGTSILFAGQGGDSILECIIWG